MTAEHFMVVIDDLELVEYQEITTFLKNAIESGELPLAITDCISIAKEISFHQFRANPDEVSQAKEYDLDMENISCDKCNKLKLDTIHQIQYVEES